MQTEDLRRFVTLARAEHLTAAADELGIPQPSLSRSLRRVEEAFGARLFEREHRGLRLNPRGRLVLAAALDATAALDAAREQIAQLDDPESGTVRLAFLHSVATTLVPGCCGSTARRRPAVRFALRQEASPTIADDLDSGAAELAITGPRPADPGLGWCVLERQRLCLVVPPAHPLAARRSVRLAEAAPRGLHRPAARVRLPGPDRPALPGGRLRPAHGASRAPTWPRSRGWSGPGSGSRCCRRRRAPAARSRARRCSCRCATPARGGTSGSYGAARAALSPAAARFRDFVVASGARPA